MTDAPPPASVEVLLATCNGEAYLAAALDSLLAQDLAEFTLIVSDDCSTDATPRIIADYAARHPDRFSILPSFGCRLGARGNFARLVDAAHADYVLFCDQDDIWQVGKISSSLALMREMESRYGSNMPLLVHSDLVVVDESLKVLGPSFFSYSGIDPARDTLSDLLLGNVVTGCTMLANRALCDLARPVPPDALMFDHWFALVAAGLGRIACLAQPTVLYRQHEANLIGARRPGSGHLTHRIMRTVRNRDILRILCRYSLQARELGARHGTRLAPADLGKVQALAGIWRQPRHRRIVTLASCGLLTNLLFSRPGLLVLLLRDGQAERQAGDC